MGHSMDKDVTNDVVQGQTRIECFEKEKNPFKRAVCKRAAIVWYVDNLIWPEPLKDQLGAMRLSRSGPCVLRFVLGMKSLSPREVEKIYPPALNLHPTPPVSGIL